LSAQTGDHDAAVDVASQEPGAGAADAYPRAVSGWLKADLFFCGVNALLVLGGLWMLVTGVDADAASVVAIETAVHAGIAAFGVPANIALLRRKPFGALLAQVALGFVGAGMLLALYEVPMRIDDPESTCPPEIVVTGAAVGMAMRFATNAIWFDKVRRAQKLLRGTILRRG